MNKKLIITLVCLLIALPIVGSAAYLFMPVSSGDRVFSIRVDKGDTKKEVIDKLNKVGALKVPFIASGYLSLSGLSDMKSGEYRFKTSSSVKSMLDDISGGKISKDINAIKVTVPEGYTVNDIADKLVSSGVISSKEEFINEVNNGDFSKFEFVKQIPAGRRARLEGYLYPDTYEFRKNTQSKEVIDRMLESFNEHAYPIAKEGADKLNISVDDVVKMASVVEKEARSDEERPIISGVFYNRIKSNMRLQSCATVLYALGEHKDKLYNKDLEIDSPYNTYKNAGLPLGPIASPGVKSLSAAANPSQHDYIYFVLQNSGKHFFTADYNEFLKAKKASNSL
ncbi:MAG: endolytic transglycosylase MltG [Clostridium sp.]|uniref:endolytic transglycosylase MltG n=1 Tax=Clostridium sp. TaxID=1506 RepID=UPI002FC6FF47